MQLFFYFKPLAIIRSVCPEKPSLGLRNRWPFLRLGFLLLFCLVFGVFNAFGQKTKSYPEKSPPKVRQQNYLVNLQRARQLREKSPTKAIDLLEKVVLEAQRKKDLRTSGEAYLLLGDIFADIDQKELAIQRYQQAIRTMNTKRLGHEVAGIHEKIGRLYLALQDEKEAHLNFQACLQYTSDQKLRLKCEEGLADVALLGRNPDASLQIVDSIESNYQMDSLENARVQARRTQIYLQQNDYARASESFYNSIENLPRNQTIDKTDYIPIQQAQEDLLSFNTVNREDEIRLRTNTANITAPTSVSSDILVQENLRIAELYEKEDNFVEAEKFILISKKVITPTTDAAAVAEVYKKSSELNKRKGEIEAALDDLEAYIIAKEKSINQLEGNLKQQVEIVKGQKDIDVGQREYALQESETELLQNKLQTQQLVNGFLLLLLTALGVFFYFLYKNIKAKRQANQKLLLKSLRTQMNPHFIFNALNSVNNFIAKNDEKAANKFLADFSRLMRQVLEYSQREFISFEEELELNQLYLKLEHFRFRDKFEYQFDHQVQQKNYELDIPPMLIQPFIENAVWHGLRYKTDKGRLVVSVLEKGGSIIVRVADDGIGRKKSQALKTANQRKYKSTGLENVHRRIELINSLYNKAYTIQVTDADSSREDTGTVVEISIPV